MAMNFLLDTNDASSAFRYATLTARPSTLKAAPEDDDPQALMDSAAMDSPARTRAENERLNTGREPIGGPQPLGYSSPRKVKRNSVVSVLAFMGTIRMPSTSL